MVAFFLRPSFTRHLSIIYSSFIRRLSVSTYLFDDVGAVGGRVGRFVARAVERPRGDEDVEQGLTRGVGE